MNFAMIDSDSVDLATIEKDTMTGGSFYLKACDPDVAAAICKQNNPIIRIPKTISIHDYGLVVIWLEGYPGTRGPLDIRERDFFFICTSSDVHLVALGYGVCCFLNRPPRT